MHIYRRNEPLLTMQWLYVLRHTAREVVEATLLVNIRAEMVYHMVYPHLHRNINNDSITAS